MKYLKDYFDKYNLLGHRYKEDPTQFDKGDSCADSCRYYYLESLTPQKVASRELIRTQFSQAVTALEIDKTGIFRRHPDQYNEPEDFSRDQMVPLILALSAWSKTDALRRLYEKQKSRLILCQNKDIFFWEYVLFWRGLSILSLYPMILLLDLGLLVNSIIRVINSYLSSDKVADDLNTQCYLIFSKNKYPTPMSLIAILIYKLRRHGALKPWTHYYRHPENPPIDQYAEIVKEYF